jgi:hypothetical protein
MISIDYIPSSILIGLNQDELCEFILDKVNHDRVLLIERALDPDKRLALIQKGLERFSDEFIGVKLLQIDIKTDGQGFFRSKSNACTLLLVAPGNAHIDQSEEGDFSVKFSDNIETTIPNPVA